MTIDEVRERIYKGECLSDMFEFTDGQECMIYKGEWNPGDDVIYIPDIDFNGICINRPLIKILTSGEIIKLLNCLYAGKDFMELVDDNEELAKELFRYVDWQHPASAINEVLDDEQYLEDENDDETEINFYPELKEYDEDHCSSIVNLEREEDEQFEIIFEVDEERYYCYITAINMDEALGIFFKYHPHVTYEMIVEHMEV